jgi:hypothetical protein
MLAGRETGPIDRRYSCCGPRFPIAEDVIVLDHNVARVDPNAVVLTSRPLCAANRRINQLGSDRLQRLEGAALIRADQS